MKIALIGPVYPYRGGIAHHTALLAQHLALQHEVDLISFRSQYPRWLVRGRDHRDPSQRPLESRAAYLIEPFAPWSWYRVGHRLTAWQPDVVVLPWWVIVWAPAWLAVSCLAHRWTHARVIYLCHNVVPHEASRLDHYVARAVLGRGDGVIVQAREQLKIVGNLLPGRPALYTPLPAYEEVARAGAATNTEQAREFLGLPGQGHPVLLYFGFVRPYKGLPILLAALAQLLGRLPAHLLIVGEFWEPISSYEEQIRRLGIGDHVTIVNRYVPNEELGLYFQAADVAVLPYLSATQSAVIQLAFGFGLPVIASKVGGLPDVIDDGCTGLLVPPGDPDALAAAIRRYFDDRLAAGMRAQIERERRRFDWQNMVDAIVTLARGSA